MLNDGGALANKQKFQVIGLQFISPGFDKNIVVMLGMLYFFQRRGRGCGKPSYQRDGRPHRDAYIVNCS
jgi:hypothetical protein